MTTGSGPGTSPRSARPSSTAAAGRGRVRHGGHLDPDLERRADVVEGLLGPRGAVDHGDLVGGDLVVGAHQLGEDHGERRPDEEERGEQPETLAAQRLADLAPGHQPDGPEHRRRRVAVGRSPRVTGRGTDGRHGGLPSVARVLARGVEEELGQARGLDREVRHRHVGPHGVEHRPGVDPRRQAQPRARRVAAGHLGGVAGDPGRLDRHVDPQVAVRARGLERPHVALEDHPALVEQRDRLAEVLHQLQLVAREQEEAAGPHVVDDHLGQEPHRHRVQPGEGLVEDQHVRPVHHGRRQLHPLGHASGKVLHLVAGPVGQAQAVEQARRPVHRPVARSRPWSRAIQRSWSSTRISRYRPRSWGMYPQREAVGLGRGPAPPLDPTGVGGEHPEEDAQERGLARTVRSQQADDLPRGDLQVDPLEHAALTEALRDAASHQTFRHGARG